MLKFLCFFGLHQYTYGERYFAEPNNRMYHCHVQDAKCSCCGKVKMRVI